MREPRRVATGIAGMLPVPGVLAGTYLVGLLAASRLPAAPLPESDGTTSFVVLVPAHNEAGCIRATLERLLAVDYPRDRFTVIVVADNCSDDTATVAAAAGVQVLERDDPVHRGKGYALRWAFERLPEGYDAVAVVDADCLVSENILRGYERRLLAGADAMQVRYLTSNAEESAHAALRSGAYLLYCVVRPTGKDRLGLSAGLGGTGMCFRASTLAAVPWTAFSLAEDREYHLSLVGAGRRVAFVDEASVTSWMAPSYEEEEAQAMRWDSGRLRLALGVGRRLAVRGLRQRDLVAFEAGVDPLVPPQALLASMNIGALAVAVASGRRRAALAALVGTAAQAAYVVGGLVSVGAPPSVWRGVADVPAFMLGRLRSLSLLAVGRGPAHWVRSSRGS